MRAAAGGPAPLAALAAFLATLAVQRAFELWLSARHVKRLLAAGAVEHGRSHFPLFVVLHTLWPVALAFEVIAGGARPGPFWPAWLALYGAAHALRGAAIAALGERWTVRVLVLPGAPLVRRGIYRWLRHPNYVAVVAELASATMMFGAWRVALAASALNLAALAIRVRVEERALGLARGLDGREAP